MTQFVYQARNRKGKKVKGVVDASTENAAADLLEEKGLLVSSVHTKQTIDLLREVDFGWSQVAEDDLTLFYLQLGNMLEAGVALLTALEAMKEQIENKRFRKVLEQVARNVNDGESFSNALSHFNTIFPDLYQSMIQVGETSGNLGATLRNVSDLHESRLELKRSVQSALAYPALLMAASIGVIVFMMVWIIPAFTEIFSKSGIPLPLPTRLVYQGSLFAKAQGFWILTVLVVILFAGNLVLRIQSVRQNVHKKILSLPIVGLLIKRIEVARWSRSLALMISSGVPILKGLALSEKLIRNTHLKAALNLISTDVQSGEQLSVSVKSKNIFPADVVQMISTGESSGTLDQMLLKTADFYNQLIKRSLKKLTGAIEPFFILLMGVIVGFIMLSVLLPIFDMIKVVGPK